MASNWIARLAAVVMAGLAWPALAQERQVRIYNWSDYVEPSVLEAFTKETGIKVIYDTFDQMETVETKLMAGKSGYDLVVVTASFLPRHIKAGLYAPLEKDKIPNLKHMWSEVTRQLGRYDPENRYAANYMWGTTGIGYNVAKVKERLGADAPLDSWGLLFDPAKAAKLADCGIHVLDATEELFPAALNYLGLNPDSKSEDDLKKAADLLAKAKPFIRKFHSSEYINALANGDICLALGYSGDVLQARKRAREAKNGVEVAYLIPKEGALMWFDSFVMPADAENKANAYAFIDFVNRPENAGKNSSFLQYATGNAEGRKLVDPETAKDPGIYPPDEVVKRLYTITPFDEKSQKVVNRMLTRIKTGR